VFVRTVMGESEGVGRGNVRGEGSCGAIGGEMARIYKSSLRGNRRKGKGMEARKWEDDLMDGRSTEHPTERRVHSFGDERG